MLTFFDLPTVLAIAEHAHQTGDDAALRWQLAGLPVLSAHPTGDDTAPLQVFDDLWLTRRWPDLSVSDVAAQPDLQPHVTAEQLPLAGPGEQLTALRAAIADGWALLAVDVDEADVTWFLARSRRMRHPKKMLLNRDRTLLHPLLRELAGAGFTVRNFPPGLDHWSATRWGGRYHLHIDVSAAAIVLSARGHGTHSRSTWRTILRGDAPADIAAAIAIAITHIPDTSHTDPSSTTPLV